MARLSIVPSITSNEPRAREYETIFIMRATVDPDEAERVVTRVKETIANLKGTLLKLENWGRRRLAYAIKRETRGVFVYLRYAAYQDLVAELERNLRLVDSVVRFQTIQLKPEVKMSDYQVDPADLAFERLEVAEEEEDLGIARRLGLVERPRMPRPEEAMESKAESFGEDDENGLAEEEEEMLAETEGQEQNEEPETPEKPPAEDE